MRNPNPSIELIVKIIIYIKISKYLMVSNKIDEWLFKYE